MNQANVPISHHLKSAWRSLNEPFATHHLFGIVNRIAEELDKKNKTPERKRFPKINVSRSAGDTRINGYTIEGTAPSFDGHTPNCKAFEYTVGPFLEGHDTKRNIYTTLQVTKETLQSFAPNCSMLRLLEDMTRNLTQMVSKEDEGEMHRIISDARAEVHHPNRVVRALNHLKNPGPQFLE